MTPWHGYDPNAKPQPLPPLGKIAMPYQVAVNVPDAECDDLACPCHDWRRAERSER